MAGRLYIAGLLAMALGLLISPAAAQSFERPRGIYLIGNVGQSIPDPQVISKPFVDGFTVRLFWESIEPTPGTLNFSVIDAALTNLAAFGGTKKLTLELFSREVPAWVLEEPGVVTYEARDIAGAGPSTGTIPAPVPWDEYTLQRWELINAALAAHEVHDPATGQPEPLSRHSLLAQITAEIPGIGGIRDQGGLLVASPVYNRAAFLGAVNRSINIVEDRFPNAFVFVLYFDMSDGAAPPLGQTILSNLRSEFFPGGRPPRLGLFKESWSCSNPIARAGDALSDSQDDTFILFQALQGWVGPFQNPEATDACLVFDPPLADGWQTGDSATDNAIRRTAVSGPEVGILHGLNNFQCRYFELYLGDLRQAYFADEYEAMHALIWAEAGAEAQVWMSY